MSEFPKPPSLSDLSHAAQVAEIILLALTAQADHLDKHTLASIDEHLRHLHYDWALEGELDQAVLDALMHFHRRLQPFLNR